MANIPQAIGNAGRYAGEWLSNIADPQRQQFQRRQQLLRQRSLYDAQSEMSRQSALNTANIEQARIGAKADDRATFGKIATDAAAPPWMKEQAMLRMGVPADQIPRLEGLGPRQIDPAAFQPQMTPLNEADIFNKRAQGQDYLSQAANRRPRAPVAGDFAPTGFQFNPEQAVQALGGNAPEPRARNIWDFVPDAATVPVGNAMRSVGGLSPEATPKAAPTALDWSKYALDVGKAGRPEFALDFMGQPVYDNEGNRVVRRPGIDLPLANSLFNTVPNSAGFNRGDATEAFIQELMGAAPQDIQAARERMNTPIGRQQLIGDGIDPDRVRKILNF